MKMNKQVTLEDAARLIKEGQLITIGGTLCQRVPAAFVREMARQGLRDLELLKPSPGYDIDLLAARGGGLRSPHPIRHRLSGATVRDGAEFQKGGGGGAARGGRECVPHDHGKSPGGLVRRAI